jgi:hypothetical protein
LFVDILDQELADTIFTEESIGSFVQWNTDLQKVRSGKYFFSISTFI